MIFNCAWQDDRLLWVMEDFGVRHVRTVRIQWPATFSSKLYQLCNKREVEMTVETGGQKISTTLHTQHVLLLELFRSF